MRIRSARGVYLDISKSSYEITLKEITFKFSSQLHLTKFIERYESEIEIMGQKLQNLYKGKYSFVTDQFALIRLYNQVETRDFYLIVNGWVVRCLNDLNVVLSVKSDLTRSVASTN